MNVRNPDITGPCHHLKTGARIRAQHEHLKNITTHPALTGEGGSSYYQLSHYDPRTNRCYVKWQSVFTDKKEPVDYHYTITCLYDGQTGESLACARQRVKYSV